MIVTPDHKMISGRECKLIVAMKMEYEEPFLKMTSLEGDSFRLNLDELNKIDTHNVQSK